MTRLRRPRDSAQLAKLVVDMATGNAPRDPESAPTWLGGIKGGETRTPKLSARRRKAGTQSSNRGMICALGHLV